AFGEDGVPVCYDDLELADLIVLVGANIAWCHPILFQRITRAKEQRPQMRIVVVDPRRTATCDAADLHLPIKSGSDVALFNGLLAWLQQHGALDESFVAAHTSGWSETLAAAQASGSTAQIAAVCGIDEAQLIEFYRLFAANPKTITAFSMGVNQSSSGTDKVNAIINCHLATARIGAPGMGPFSITGQPNAMGGREVGGLANMLAAHMDLERPDHRDTVQTFWNSPRIASRGGLKAVDLFNAIERGEVKAVWIMATNPVVSMPDADQAKRALEKCELVVVSDCIAATDTTAYADVLLPATGWGEKDGTVTNSERRITRQRAFLPPAGEARHDWWIICRMAQAMGFDVGFNFTSAAEIFDEHARLSAFRNDKGSGRLFNLQGLSGLTPAQFDALPPTQWPALNADASVIEASGQRLFCDHRFSTPDGRARFVATPARLPQNGIDAEFPLVLNTGRVRDHWHTMTRTGRSPRLAQHRAEPYVEIHPDDAVQFGLRHGELGSLSTRWGSCVARVDTQGGAARGNVFVPIHWSAQFASAGRVGALVNPVVDPVSGEPEFKHTPVKVAPFAARWYGFALSRTPLISPRAEWWTRITGTHFTRYELAGSADIADWPGFAATLFDVDARSVSHPENSGTASDWLDYVDAKAGVYRAARIVDGRLDACLFVAPQAQLPSRTWLASLFERNVLELADRKSLLAARPAAAQADVGPLVCSCFGVGRNTIADAIRKQRLSSASEVTAAVKAGGNCGSCVPEIRRLIQDAAGERVTTLAELNAATGETIAPAVSIPQKEYS
ncbi:MAG: Assimilatory nitrate reductase large subunit, partial [Nevskia sp.]|nr:Assimilatory nitrate reductase large subunit [Nevskia sp.]